MCADGVLTEHRCPSMRKQAQRQQLLDKYKVVPDQDPESLEEAKHLMQQVRSRKGSGLQQPFDSLRLDWIQVLPRCLASLECFRLRQRLLALSLAPLGFA